MRKQDGLIPRGQHDRVGTCLKQGGQSPVPSVSPSGRGLFGVREAAPDQPRAVPGEPEGG